MKPGSLIEKVCPVVLRGPRDDREVLVFMHPLAGIQLVKGTRELPESIASGALRELAEESGIVDAKVVGSNRPSSSIAPDQLWHFVNVEVPNLPDQWAHDTKDDGGHRFEFFWWKLSVSPTDLWHGNFVRALQHIISNLDVPATDSADTVLARYAAHINQHHFDDLVPLIAEDAQFWFSDGTHCGIAAIRTAFEATWDTLSDETYWLEDLSWISRGDIAASCIYRFCWIATVDGVRRSGSGRGTTVLARRDDGWKIVHEHLSALPT